MMRSLIVLDAQSSAGCHDMPTPDGNTSANEHADRDQGTAPSTVFPPSTVLT